MEADDPDPRSQWTAAALEADVMLFRLDDGRWEPGTPGFTFDRWIKEGHQDHGWPTVDDLDYHLTTLFLEVRPRGFVELRAGEAVPDWMRAAQVVLVSSVIYDDSARSELIDLLGPYRSRLPELWRQAAVHGVADPELGELAGAVWEAGLRGVERVGSDYFGHDAQDAPRFVDRYTLRGRSPADELRVLHEDDPARSLAWAASQS